MYSNDILFVVPIAILAVLFYIARIVFFEKEGELFKYMTRVLLRSVVSEKF